MSQYGSLFEGSFMDRPSSPPLTFESVTPEQPRFDAYQQRIQLKQSIDAAVAAGASMHIDFPQVVVLGSQSSGKSTLFEGISGVPLPRNTGTCTRCPLLCRMARKADPWRCKIEILREVDEKGKALPVAENIPFGPAIDSPENVCERIQRAQVAILHPKRNPNEFVDMKVLDVTGDGFSLNSIVVDIEGPDVTDLSFVDLPGIIADDGEGNDHVRRVEEMANKYIAKESNLILLVFHCIDDIQNQGARRLARAQDPDGKRTITVMTKPDKIESVEAGPWREKLRASENWFCVRQPGPSERRKKTQSEAHEEEMKFFRKDPWASEYNDPSTRSRLGTENLTSYLNIRLLDWIVAKLPGMQEDLQTLLRNIQDALDRLPTPVDDPVKCTNELIWKFGEVLRGAVNIYNFKIPPLVGNCRRSLERFTDVLFYHLFPRFRPFPSPMEGQGSTRSFDEFPKALPRSPPLPSNITAIQMPRIVYLDEVTRRCDVGRTREMPGNYPYGIQKDYMESSVEVWRDQAELMLEDIFRHISSDLKVLVFKHFTSFGRAGMIWAIVQSHLESRRAAVRKTLRASLGREKTCSLVYNCAEYLHYRSKYFDHYRSQHPAIASRFGPSASDTIHAVANIIPDPLISTIGHKVADRLDGQDTEDDALPDDEEHGIRVMAETRAFYHVAVRRYAEGTAQIVFHDLLLDIQGGPELEQKLRQGIGMCGPDAEDRCRAFVEPSSDIIKERNNLKNKQALLRDILEQFSHFF